jgi:glutathione S-transferase
MLILRSAPPSPFGRKVKIAAALLGLSADIRVEPTDTNDPADSIRRQNPLGKIPSLILEDGTVLFDSRVILEFLDAHAGGGRIIPASGAERFAVLRMHALADGLMDAALLQVYEIRFRPEEIRSEKWRAYQAEKVDRVLEAFEREPPARSGEWHVGQIALACALGYLDLRFEGRWRANHPKLVAWLEAFAASVPAFAATKVQP